QWLGLPELAGLAVGLLLTPLLVLVSRPLVDLLFVVQINNHWPYLCAFARGEPTCFDAPIDACARRVIEAVRAHEADEIVVVGPSGGGARARAVVTRALELDPEVGRRGPPLILLTPGSIAPGAALHPGAVGLRAIFARLAVEPSIIWIDLQARKDFLNFWEFDPIVDLGIEVGPERCNPLIWKVRIHDMLTEELYRKIGFDFFRLHYQFIMGNDRRAPYDYFMLLCGPLPVVTWASDPM